MAKRKTSGYLLHLWPLLVHTHEHAIDHDCKHDDHVEERMDECIQRHPAHRIEGAEAEESVMRRESADVFILTHYNEHL